MPAFATGATTSSTPTRTRALVAELAADDDPGAHRVLVWEDDEGIAGFVDLRDRGEHVELLRVFLRTELIGHGHGRALWDRAVEEASRWAIAC